MRRRTKKIILRICLGLLVTAGLVTAGIMLSRARFGALKDKIKELNSVISAYAEQTRDVVCVNCNISAGTELRAEDLITVAVSAASVPKDVIALPEEASGAVLRIDVSEGTMLTAGMLAKEVPDSDIREVEYRDIVIGDNISEGDVVDVRLCSRGGCDYVVVAKTRIRKIDEQRKTVRFNCSEKEILLLDSAIVDTLANEGSRLYLAKYIEQNLQSAAVVNYVPSEEVAEMISFNPNITGNTIQ